VDPHATDTLELDAPTAMLRRAGTAVVERVPRHVVWSVGWMFPPGAEEQGEYRWPMIAAAVAVQASVALLVAAPAYVWIGPEAVPGLCVGLLMGGLAIALARARRVRASVWWTTAALFTSCCAMIYATGGVASPALALLVALPTVPLTMRRVTDGVVWFLAVVAVLVALNHPAVNAWVLPPGGPVPHGLAQAGFITWTMLIVSLGMYQTADGSLRLADQLQDAVVRLEGTSEASRSANRAKSVFLASMSHEIRTPMNGVLGAARLMAHTRLDREQRELVRMMDQSASALLGILDDILDFSRIEAGVIPIHPADVSTRELVGSVITLISTLADTKGLQLKADLAHAPPGMRIDPSRMRQVLVNLVGNAVKYTERGEVVLRVFTLRAPAPGRARVRFEVSDTGVGISPEQQRTIFDRFTRGVSAERGSTPGTGLGLAICRGIVAAMGGRLTLSSTPGAGSTFRFDLDVELADPPHAAPVEPPAPAGCGVRVLLVEDNVVNQRVARAMLEHIGCVVDVANDGREGVAAAARAAYDIVFMDCAMPEMDGYESTRAMRAQVGATAPDVPVVALTADVMPATRARCVAAGMTAFVTKPTTMECLADTIRRLCPERPLRQPDGAGATWAGNQTADQA
jgi:signal transduction histidine kinase/CheY-like chemotaxis protein